MIPGGNVIHYPESFATGYGMVIEIQDGLSARLVDYTLNSDFSYQREPTKEFMLIIYIYIYQGCKRLKMTLNDKAIIESRDTDYSGLMLTNNATRQSLFVTKGSIVRGITIQLTEKWLKDNITSPKDLGILKEQDFFQSIIRPKYRRLLEDIFITKNNSPVPNLYLSTRVMHLADLFLEDILKNGLKGNLLPRSPKEMQQLLLIEEYLTEHFQEPFPSIDALAKIALMSPTKLKKSFKSAFGMSLFNYFQKNRMHKAKEWLQAGTHSVSDTGKILGYHNLSNFSVAFKKEFGVLPKHAQELT